MTTLPPLLRRLAAGLAALLLVLPLAASADPGDISAAARGVVRVVIVEVDNGQLTPLSHGSGFAVAPERIVTNAHVVQEVAGNPMLTIGLIPSQGSGSPVYGRVIAVDARRDLALIATTSAMQLPPLTIAGNPQTDSGNVSALGYPMNVDRAQGLSLTDIFHPQPPVRSTGALSGRRPARDFDSLLHTAPIARGSSGGPLLDDCGRVLGVNSFGTDSGSADAEFYFAVSTRELLPFLRANGITPRVNGGPCRSLADVEAQERQQSERAQIASDARTAADQQRTALRKEQLSRDAEFAILAERESGLALSLILLMAAMGAAGLAIHAHHTGLRHNAEIGFVLAGVAVLGAGVAWTARPGFDQIGPRIDAMMRNDAAADKPAVTTGQPAEGALVCVIDAQRSRVTNSATDDVALAWSAGGCVNGRTQYGLASGEWARVLVPAGEDSVSVNRFDPVSREYHVERYLLDRDAMARVRGARAALKAPTCGGGQDAALSLGSQQAAVIAALPPQPNERLVYKCSPAR